MHTLNTLYTSYVSPYICIRQFSLTKSSLQNKESINPAARTTAAIKTTMTTTAIIMITSYKIIFRPINQFICQNKITRYK